MMAGQMFRFKDEAEYAAFIKRIGRPPQARPVTLLGVKEPDDEPTKKPRVKKVKPPRLPKPRSPIEQSMSEQIVLAGLPKPIEWPKQYQPFPDRKYRVDFAWPDLRLILEVDGAVHRIKKTFKSGFERGALLLIDGWWVLHVGGDDVRSGTAIEWLKKLKERLDKEKQVNYDSIADEN